MLALHAQHRCRCVAKLQAPRAARRAARYRACDHGLSPASARLWQKHVHVSQVGLATTSPRRSPVSPQSRPRFSTFIHLYFLQCTMYPDTSYTILPVLIIHYTIHNTIIIRIIHNTQKYPVYYLTLPKRVKKTSSPPTL